MTEEKKDVAIKVSGEIVQFGGFKLTQPQFDVLQHTIAPGLTTEELELFFYECKRRGVHPLDRMIYPIKRNDKNDDTGSKKLTFQCSIDYFRAASEDTHKYLGQMPVEFGEEKPLSVVCPKTGAGHDDTMVPTSATVTLIRKGEDGDQIKVPATAFWTEYYPGEKMGFMWRKMPKGQLAKCAEALAHRKAFPRELGGLYANEEVEKIGTDVPFARADSVKALPKTTPYAPKPAAAIPAADRQPGQDEEEKTGALHTWPVPPEIANDKVQVALYNSLMELAEGDINKAEAILYEQSSFEGDRGTQFMSMKKLPWKTNWAGKTLGKVKALMG